MSTTPTPSPTASALAARQAAAAARYARDDHAVGLALAAGTPASARALARVVPGLSRSRAERALDRLGVALVSDDDASTLPDLAEVVRADPAAPLPGSATSGIIRYAGPDGCTLDSALELDACDALTRAGIPHRAQRLYRLLSPLWDGGEQSADFQASPRVVVEVGSSRGSEDRTRRAMRQRAARAAGLTVITIAGHAKVEERIRDVQAAIDQDLAGLRAIPKDKREASLWWPYIVDWHVWLYAQIVQRAHEIRVRADAPHVSASVREDAIRELAERSAVLAGWRERAALRPLPTGNL